MLILWRKSLLFHCNVSAWLHSIMLWIWFNIACPFDFEAILVYNVSKCECIWLFDLIAHTSNYGWASLNIWFSWGMVAWEMDRFPLGNQKIFFCCNRVFEPQKCMQSKRYFFQTCSLKKSMLHARLNALIWPFWVPKLVEVSPNVCGATRNP